MPSTESIVNRTYRPLSRPIFIYVNRSRSGQAAARWRLFIAAYLRLASEGRAPGRLRAAERAQLRAGAPALRPSRDRGLGLHQAAPEDRLDDLLVIGQQKPPAPARSQAATRPLRRRRAGAPACDAQAPSAPAQVPTAAPASSAAACSSDRRQPFRPAIPGCLRAVNPWLPASTHSSAEGAAAAVARSGGTTGRRSISLAQRQPRAGAAWRSRTAPPKSPSSNWPRAGRCVEQLATRMAAALGGSLHGRQAALADRRGAGAQPGAPATRAAASHGARSPEASSSTGEEARAPSSMRRRSSASRRRRWSSPIPSSAAA